jgi:hypothetical protein
VYVSWISRNCGVRVAMTGCRLVSGLMMLKVYLLLAGSGGVVRPGLGAGSVLADAAAVFETGLRAHRAVVVFPCSSVRTKSKEPVGSG